MMLVRLRQSRQLYSGYCKKLPGIWQRWEARPCARPTLSGEGSNLEFSSCRERATWIPNTARAFDQDKSENSARQILLSFRQVASAEQFREGLRRGWASSASGSEGGHGLGQLYELKLAQTGEGIAECELIRWFVAEGEEVASFQPVCEVQSDKATVEITSRYDGKLVRTHFVPGEIVKVGEVLCDVVVSASDENIPRAAQSPLGQPEPSIPVEGGKNGLHEIAVGTKDKKLATKDKILATPAIRHFAKTYGLNIQNVCGTGENGRVLKDDIFRSVAEREGVEYEARSEEAAFEGHESKRSNVVKGPGALNLDKRKVKAEKGLDWALPKDENEVATLDGGKMTKEVHLWDERTDYHDRVKNSTDAVVPIRGYRRAMAKTMAAANEVPHFYLMEEVAVDRLIELRRTLKEEVGPGGVPISHMPVLVKALSQALLRFPMLNATVNGGLTEVLCKGAHNIGIAMATPRGLVVPNVKNCEEKSVFEIAQELGRLRFLASENGLTSEDLTGGTITISNVGTIGGTYAGPLINLPEVSIVALGKILKLPRFDSEGNIYPASIMNVSWAADHRVVDGSSLAGLSTEWKRLLEKPERLLLHLR